MTLLTESPIIETHFPTHERYKIWHEKFDDPYVAASLRKLGCPIDNIFFPLYLTRLHMPWKLRFCAEHGFPYDFDKTPEPID